MDALILDATKRDATKPKMIRAAGSVPAVYYGHGVTPVSLTLNYQAFRKVYTKAGGNTIIELTVDGKKTPVLVHQVQFDPVSDMVSHVDFLHVDMKQEVTTAVKIVTFGIAPAIKDLGGVLDIQKHEIKIKCLPRDLIHEIQVDITPIIDFHTSIHVSDLLVPATIKILDRAEDTVVTVVPPRAEEVATPAAATEGAVAGAAPAEAAAGAAPAAGAPAAEPKK